MNKAFHPTQEQIAALNAFAKAYGVYWKRELRTMWQEGSAPLALAVKYHAPLRQIRNSYGGMAYIAKHKVAK
jgi:hypothetical protein